MVSVIIPTCGNYFLLLQSIRSVRKQSIKSEIIVVIDGNCYNDQQIKKINSLADVVCHVDPTDDDKHVAVSLNTALDCASNEFIAYLGDDNLYVDERRLETATDCLEANTDCVAYADRARWMRVDGLVVPQKTIGNYQYRTPHLDGHDELMKCIVKSESNFLVHDCVVHRKTGLRYRTSQKYNDEVCPIDWDFWCRLISFGKFCCVDSVGVEAFLPGIWRNGFTETQAIKFRRQLMGKMAKNISGKTQIVVNMDTGKKMAVPEGAMVDEGYVTTASNMLLPGFVIDYDSTPRIQVSESPVDDEVDKREITRDLLDSMSYTDLLKTAETVGANPITLDEDVVKRSIISVVNGVEDDEDVAKSW